MRWRTRWCRSSPATHRAAPPSSQHVRAQHAGNVSCRMIRLTLSLPDVGRILFGTSKGVAWGWLDLRPIRRGIV